MAAWRVGLGYTLGVAMDSDPELLSELRRCRWTVEFAMAGTYTEANHGRPLRLNVHEGGHQALCPGIVERHRDRTLVSKLLVAQVALDKVMWPLGFVRISGSARLKEKLTNALQLVPKD